MNHATKLYSTQKLTFFTSPNNRLSNNEKVDNYIQRTKNVNQHQVSVSAHSIKGTYWIQSFELNMPGTFLRLILTTGKDEKDINNRYIVRPLVLDIPILVASVEEELQSDEEDEDDIASSNSKSDDGSVSPNNDSNDDENDIEAEAESETIKDDDDETIATEEEVDISISKTITTKEVLSLAVPSKKDRKQQLGIPEMIAKN